MSLSNGILANFTPDFKADTAAAVFESAVKKANDWLAAITESIDLIGDDPDTDSAITADQVRSVFDSHDLTADGCVSGLSGFTTNGDLIPELVAGLNAYASGSINSLDDASISLKLASGANANSVGLLQLVDQVKGNVAAAVCSKAAILASEFESISDRIEKFTSDVSAYLDPQYSGFSTTISYYKSLISSRMSRSKVLDTIFEASGTNQLRNGAAIGLVDVDVSKYTGANPLGAFSFNTVKTAAVTVGRVIGAAAYAVWQGVKALISSVWNKAKKYVTAVFDNPYDVKDSGDSKLSPSFIGFQYQSSIGTSEDPYDHELYGFSADDVQAVSQYLTAHAGSWYVVKTLGGENALSYSSVADVSYNSETGRLHISLVGLKTIAKPYPLASDVLPISSSNGISTVEGTPMNLSRALTARAGGMYLDTSASEVDLANAFVHGWTFNAAVLRRIGDELNIPAVSNEYTTLRYSWAPYWQSDVITNLDWLKIASGFMHNTSDNTDSFTYCPRVSYSRGWSRTSGSYEAITWDSQNLNQLTISLLNVIMYTILQNIRPARNYDGYVPYTVDSTELSVGRFDIKTDSENQEVANKLLSAIIIVAVAAVVVTTGIVVARKVSRSLYWKRTEFVAKSDAAMWNGEQLSASDKRKYLRCKRKLDAVSSVTEGTVGSSVGEAIRGLNMSSIVDAIAGSSESGSEVTTLSQISNSSSADARRIITMLK